MWIDLICVAVAAGLVIAILSGGWIVVAAIAFGLVVFVLPLTVIVWVMFVRPERNRTRPPER